MTAHALLVANTERVVAVDTPRAARMLTDASWACFMAGRIADGLRTAERACEVASAVGGGTEVLAKGVLGIAKLLSGDTRDAIPLLAEFQAKLADPASLDRPYLLIRPDGQVLTWMEEYDAAKQTLLRAVEAARAQAALGALAYLLASQAELDFRTGNWAAANAGAGEAVRIADETEQAPVLGFALAVLGRVEAAQGREGEARAHLSRAHGVASTGIGAVFAYAHAARGLLALGVGHLDEAIAELEHLRDLTRQHGLRHVGVIQWPPDLIEAYVRCGRAGDAERELAVYEKQAQATERTWAVAAAARCRGLVAAADRFEAEFERALELHAQTPTPFERARTELCLGERLRRARRRADAREPLRSALETFQRLGAAPWAERARTELEASGETARRGEAALSDELTPQELQVALVVVQGATNREAGAALFLSPKTIEAHLGRIYRKLNVRSRTELAHRLAVQQAVET